VIILREIGFLGEENTQRRERDDEENWKLDQKSRRGNEENKKRLGK